MPKPIVIWGAGQHARTAFDVAISSREFEIVGFIDNTNPSRHGDEFCGAEILGGTDELESLASRGVPYIFVAIGDNKLRLELYRYAAKFDLAPVTLVHPFTAIAADCVIGSGSIIRAGAVLEVDVEVGAGVIIGANCSLAHGCRLEQGVRIASGSTLSGNVILEQQSRIGPGSTILNYVRVGAGALLGAGSVLTRDLPANKVAMGCPAKVVRDVADGDF
jgi:sugar O-acyltransferase (sialic acid O-acetyltransferase NeuD family)